MKEAESRGGQPCHSARWTAGLGQEQGLCQLGIRTAYTVFCLVFCLLGFNFLRSEMEI